MGVVAPNGVGIDAFWRALEHGESGVGPVTKCDVGRLPSRIAGEIRNFDPLDHLPRRDVVRTDAFIQYGLIAALEAIAHAKLTIAEPERVGVAVGSGMGGIPLLLRADETLRGEGPQAVSPYALPGMLPNMAASWISMRTGARGPIYAPSTACAAGAQAIGDAYRAIATGVADVMLAGGSDALIHPLVIACFCALHALSTSNDSPTEASRPFDARRDGFVLAEGAGVLVLEERDAALARGAHVYAEVTGYAITADAHHPTAPSTDGPARAMRLALAEAGISPGAIDYINAHGTSTPQNDANETRAIKMVFGDDASRIPISSTKSMTGHLVGAAGAVEAVATVLAMEHGVVPPTINYLNPDPECDLDYVPREARRVDIRRAMSNSFAFGGINASLVFQRFTEEKGD